MRILVTGGAGFIGSHLCSELTKDSDNEIISLDNYSTGSRENHVPGVDYIRGNTQSIDKYIEKKPDIVYHLGEYSRVEQSFDDLDLIQESNLSGTFSTVQFCLKNNCRLVYAGSSTKFGDGGKGRSQSPYGWSKALNTDLVNNCGSWFGLNYAIVYFYNAYGPREIRHGKYATVIAKFSEHMRLGENLPVNSPGTQVRNFTHVEDIVSGLILVGQHGHGDGYGIGGDKSYSINEIAELFGGNISMRPARSGNRADAELVVTKTKGLGWSANHKLEDYIAKLRDNRWLI